jgi:hypothetical protein
MFPFGPLRSKRLLILAFSFHTNVLSFPLAAPSLIGGGASIRSIALSRTAQALSRATRVFGLLSNAEVHLAFSSLLDNRSNPLGTLSDVVNGFTKSTHVYLGKFDPDAGRRPMLKIDIAWCEHLAGLIKDDVLSTGQIHFKWTLSSLGNTITFLYSGVPGTRRVNSGPTSNADWKIIAQISRGSRFGGRGSLGFHRIQGVTYEEM